MTPFIASELGDCLLDELSLLSVEFCYRRRESGFSSVDERQKSGV